VEAPARDQHSAADPQGPESGRDGGPRRDLRGLARDGPARGAGSAVVRRAGAATAVLSRLLPPAAGGGSGRSVPRACSGRPRRGRLRHVQGSAGVGVRLQRIRPAVRPGVPAHARAPLGGVAPGRGRGRSRRSGPRGARAGVPGRVQAALGCGGRAAHVGREPDAGGLQQARRDRGVLALAARLWSWLPAPLARLGSGLYRYLG